MPSGDRVSQLTAPALGCTLPMTPKSFRTQDANIRKVAVMRPDGDMQLNQPGQLTEFDQTRPLGELIHEICGKFNLSDPQAYALRFHEPDQKLYITEQNRKDLKDGQLLKLAPSAALTAQHVKTALSGSNQEDKISALRKLSFLAADITFAEEYIKIQGLHLVIEIVTNGNFRGDPLAYTLKSFVSLMEHNTVSWDVLQPEFIRRVADCVNISANKLDTSCLRSALDILESVVLNCKSNQSVLEQVVTTANIVVHLESPCDDVHKNTLALINALFTQAEPPKRRKIAENLQSKSMRNTILSNVIKAKMSPGMAHELYVLQTLLLNLKEETMNTPVDASDVGIVREIEELRRIAFDVDGDPNINTVRKSPNSCKDYKKLGFEKDKNPVEDFATVPPGILALDLMLYFARNHGESYMKVVLENSTRADEHDCPFVQASKVLTTTLCKILNIGEQPSDDGEIFYVMFFTHDRPFEEFFSICIQLLNKTWREMRATEQDFKKVLDVVTEQISRVLSQFPSSFENFKSKVNSLSYAEINKIWESERQAKEGQGQQLKPILELRDKITPEMMELIRLQRLNFLTGGSRFVKFSKTNKMKDKFWYWRLAPNRKALLYEDCGESDGPSKMSENLQKKVQVTEIQKLLVGTDCPHYSKEKALKKTTVKMNFAFAFLMDPDEEPFCFVASSESEFHMWTDGLNYLLGNEMTSSLVKNDLETLLMTEVKIRLLETEGISIPSEAPPIPDPPADFNFAYRL